MSRLAPISAADAVAGLRARGTRADALLALNIEAGLVEVLGMDEIGELALRPTAAGWRWIFERCGQR